jgi:hypothetical protein
MLPTRLLNGERLFCVTSVSVPRRHLGNGADTVWRVKNDLACVWFRHLRLS